MAATRCFPRGLVLGAGWALSGACPATSLVQVGEGKLLALLTVAGIVFGTYASARLRSAGAPVGLVRDARPASS